MKAINVDGQMTAKELLSLVDGYYKLEKPIGYTMGKTSSTTGEISGMININTDVKVLDGITKVITSLADDTSYYIENVWQDGDALEVSAMDETSGGDEGGGGESDFSTAEVTFLNSLGDGDRAPYVATSICVLSDRIAINRETVNRGSSVVLTVPLYKGKLSLAMIGVFGNEIDMEIMPQFSGDAALSGMDIVITGNCTINAAGITVS